MDMLEKPNRKLSGRQLVFGLMLFTAMGAAGAAWYWNQHVNAPDHGIVIRTEAEAVDGARRFLAAARIATGDYDLFQTSDISKDRLKGQIVWRVAWRTKSDAKRTNEIRVLAFERGMFYYDDMSNTKEGVYIEGGLIDGEITNIMRNHYVLK
jgi:hypothetical protein